VRRLLERGYKFLHSLKIVHEPELHPDALRDDLVNQAFADLGLDPTKGLFEIQPGQANPFKGDDLAERVQ